MINLITGRQSDNLQNEIIRQAVKTYNNNKEKTTFIIVPNHIKFTTEVKTLNQLTALNNKQAAVHNLQILSFSRLAWYFLRNTNIALLEILDDAASAMLLKQIVQKRKDELLLFNSNQINKGSLNQLYKAILSVRQGNLNLEELNEEDLDEETARKIHDLRIIYDDFISSLGDKFATKDEIQFQLNAYLAKSDNLKNMNFYFTDFSHFSLQELMTVQLISKKAENTTFAFKTKDGSVDEHRQAGDYDYVVQRTIRQLTRFWEGQNLDYISQKFVNNTQTQAAILNGLWTKDLVKTGQNISDFIQPVKADSRYAEAYFVARTIYQQVALGKYRYRDFLVLAPNLSEYETYLAPILRQNKIPFFDDLQRQMKYHPLVVIVESLRKLINNDLQTNDILAIAKTKLLIPNWYRDEQAYQYDLDELENFVLAHGINHNLWHRDLHDFIDAKVIKLDDAQDEIERLEKLRKYLVSRIDDLMHSFENITDPQEGSMIFWNFLIKNNVNQRLEAWRSVANENGNLQAAQEPEQVWSTLQKLIKDYLLIAQEFDTDSFFELLVSGFSEATFSQIPSTLDAVNISELGMVQIPDYKQIFIIGATSSNLPQIQSIPGFLTSENIEKMNGIADENKYLEDSQKINNLDQNYQFGNVLSLANDKIFISYPVLNTSNEQLQPSIFYRQLIDLTDAKEFAQHDLPNSEGDAFSFITTPQASLGYIAYMKKNEYDYSTQLLELTQEQLPTLTSQILKANEFKNVPVDLGTELAQKLYGTRIETSVSQLEQYYENSFDYFLNYGLRLRPRFENELDVIQAGNYYHETFDHLVKYLQQNHEQFDDVSAEDLSLILHNIQLELQSQGKYRQLLNDPFNKYLFKKLDQSTSNIAHFWHKNITKTIFRPSYSELSFGKGQKVKGLSYNISDKDGRSHTIDLRGKIDRIDLAPVDNKIISQVIDYKSSEHKFDLAKFANGISMQMVSYLSVLNQNAEFFTKNKDTALDVLGAFYQTITKKVTRKNSKSAIDANYQIDATKETVKQFQYQGILVDDVDLLKKVEPELQNASELYRGASLTQKGKFRGNLRVFTNEQIKLLLQYNDYLVQRAAEEILDGQIKLNPYRKGQQSALDYSIYKDILFFDAMLPENEYHNINSIKSVNDLMDYINKILRKDKE